MVISHSVRVVPQVYRLPAPGGLDSSLIVVRGDDVTVDFDGATLQGTAPAAVPDLAAGVAIRIDGGRNVRIINVRIRGYKVAILARGTRDLVVTNIDASYNWKPRLFSLVEHESLVDWVSYHHNEKDEWLRYGAAMYLVDVQGGAVRRSVVRQGMNALLLVRSDHLRVQDNDFSFNSGLGIGLYRSSDNTIVRNRVDFNVRGYSNGFYRRGQDSADILLYEQSDRNVVAFNSATHGGDGLFLWAGQSTMDSGEGGANDNLFFGNDFSFAPANAMEATFSRNSFVANRAEGSDYGLWAGYSFESQVIANCFRGNRTGVAIEHGQDNVIAANVFLGDSAAIRLWADSIEPSDWGYPRHRDTRSRDYRIEQNRFVANRIRIQSPNTSGLTVDQNDSSVTTLGDCPVPLVPTRWSQLVPALPGVPRQSPSSADARRSRAAIVVDEWGPYDWRSPRLWPVDSTRAVPLRLAVLGPPGSWRVVARRGVSGVSRAAGQVGDTIAVTPEPRTAGDWMLTLEYQGRATVSSTGTHRPVGTPVRFSYEHFEPPVDWDIRFFAWADSADPRTAPDRFDALLRSEPLVERRAPRLDYLWYRPTIPELPQARFALEATTAVDLAPGSYILRTISDDGIRVWVDDTLRIDRWTLHESAVDAVPVAAGRHALRLRFFQVDGWTELRLDIVRGAPSSLGLSGRP
jgi:parallel beta-helix repeat protein